MMNFEKLLVIVLVCFLTIVKSGESFGTFGLDVHHRYSDVVKDFLGHDGLPEIGTPDYFTAMAHHDHLVKARRLAGGSDGNNPTTPSVLTFAFGNDTYRVRSLGNLHYSFVTVGTPPADYIVALDTGSDLFWLPCDCTTCVRSFNLSNGKALKLEIYSPSTSSTSSPVPCNSTLCGSTRGCLTRLNTCSYKEVYRTLKFTSSSSTGILVNDVLRMGTYETPSRPIVVPITLGCGMIQTDDFVNDSAINGLLGLGMNSISVPSILASKGVIEANSLSMCFGPDGLGRIEFGYKGSPLQKTTPFTVQPSNPTYNVTVTKVGVGRTVTDLTFTALFESGMSYTYLTEPAYSVIVEGFNSLVTEPRYRPPTPLLFDYCYNLSVTQETYNVPFLNLTMAGGDKFYVTAPTTVYRETSGQDIFCLTLAKSTDINIIGQNFMTGYRMVFDRDDMVLGWEESDCYDSILSTNTPNRGNSPNAPPPPSNVFTFSPSTPTPPSPTPLLRRPVAGNAAKLSSLSTNIIWMVIISISFHHFIMPHL